MAKKVSAQEQSLGNEISKIISGFNDITENSSIDFLQEVEEEKKKQIELASKRIDLDELEAGFKAKTTQVISAMYEFYGKIVPSKRSDYIKFKAEAQIETAFNLAMQLKMARDVVKAVYESINAGCTEPRVIESYVSLNKALSELNKDYANVWLFLENSCQQTIQETIKMDNSNNLTEIGNGIAEQAQLPSRMGTKYITADSKKMLSDIREHNQFTEDDADEMHSDEYKAIGDIDRLISPTNKADLITEFNIDTSLIKSDSEDTGAMSLLNGMI